MKSIIFLNSFPTNSSFGKKLQIDWFIKNNYNVEFWDLSNIFFTKKNITGYFKNPDHQFNTPHNKTYYNIEELKKNILAKKKYVFIYLSKFFNYSLIQDNWLINHFNNHHIHYIFQHFDPVDLVKPKYNLIKYINLFRQRNSLKNLNPKGIITSGSLGVNQVKFFYKNTKIINIPSVKIKWSNFENKINKKYSVFVDESILYSPDNGLLDVIICNDIDGYYERVLNLLKKIKKILNHDIIIAASNKFKYPVNFFHEFEIRYDETFDLINYANLVIGSGSLALQQCIKSNKSVLLLKDKSFLKEKLIDLKYNEFIFKQKASYIEDINKNHILKILNKNTKYYKKIEYKYFNNLSNFKSYPEILNDYIDEVYKN